LAVNEAGVHAASSPRVRSTMTLRTVRQSVAQGSGVTCNVPGECGTGVGVDCTDAEAWHGARAAGAVSAFTAPFDWGARSLRSPVVASKDITCVPATWQYGLRSRQCRTASYAGETPPVRPVECASLG
jgi:hypothetical protein